MKHPITSLDNAQIARYSYDEDTQAQRVVITGVSGLAEAVKEGLATANISIKSEPSIQKFPEVERIVFQERVKVVEVEKIVLQTEIKEIEKVVIVPQIEYREIQVPIIQEKFTQIPFPVKETQIVTVEKQSDLYIKIFVIVNGLATLGLLALNIFKR